MFGNPFLKNDSLLEAVKAAQHDGECRRQAEKIVNEEFGVYSRKAVVREHLAAYDAALEETYAALREGNKENKEKKKEHEEKTGLEHIKKMGGFPGQSLKRTARELTKEGNDGNLANNYPPYDKVTRGDVIAGATGKDQMGGKKKMEEGSAVSGEDPGMAVAKQAGAAQQAQTPSSTPKRTGNAAGSTISNARDAAGMNEEQIDEISTKLARSYLSKSTDSSSNKRRTQGVFRARGKMTGEPYEKVDKSGITVGHVYPKVLTKEEQIDEVSKGRAISAYRQKEGEERDTSKLHGLIKRKFGKETAKHAERAGAQDTVGLVRRGEDRGKEDSIARDQRLGSAARKTKSGKVHKQDTSTLKGNIKRRLGSHTKANLPEEAQIDEATRKHFRQHAADISKISDQDERNKAASAAASTYARLNPRFDHAKFHKAAGSTAHEAQAMKESVIASLFEKYSFKAAQETGKSVNEIAMTTPPAIVQPAVSGVKQTQAAKPLATARFGQQGAGARPMTATPSVTRTMASPASRPIPSVAGGMSQAGKQAASQSIRSSIAQKMTSAASAGKDIVSNIASRSPTVARIAGLGARMNPVAGAIATGAAASQALGQLATGTETGRAIGRSIGRAISPPVSTLPARDTTPNKAPAAPKGMRHTDSTLSADGSKIVSRKSNPGYEDPGRWENEARSKAGSMMQIRKGELVPQEKQLGKPSASSEKSTQSFLDTQLGKTPAAEPATTTTAAPKAVPTPPSRPADLGQTAPKAVPTPPASSERPAPATMQNPDQNRTKVMKEEVQVGNYKYRIV